MKSKAPLDHPPAFEIISKQIAAMAAQDFEAMESLHAGNYIVDWVYSDAFESPPTSTEESKKFFPAWFAGFGEMICR